MSALAVTRGLKPGQVNGGSEFQVYGGYSQRSEATSSSEKAFEFGSSLYLTLSQACVDQGSAEPNSAQ